MNRLDYVIDSEHNGETIKRYLRTYLGLSSRALIQLKKTPVGITRNGNHAKVIERIYENDVLSLFIDEAPPKEYERENIPLDILYEDENFLVVNKQAGMAMYPVGAHRSGSLLNAVEYQRDFTFRAIYRLDRNTSGIVVIAKNRLVSSSVTLEKKYLAVCCGELPETGSIGVAIGHEEGSIIKRTTGYGKKALTTFRTLIVAGDYSLAEMEIQTGRTHQIRVHMASMGFPLAGDDLYGGNMKSIGRQALHCCEVRLSSVAAKTDRTFFCKVPSDMALAFPELFNQRKGE
ncbi:MAG: RluA family pseudouridine synthase [Oscillospiraceae bacterium]